MNTKPSYLECKLRFATDVTLEALMTIYMDNFDKLETYTQVTEAAKATKVYSKRELEVEATKMANRKVKNSDDALIVKLGKAVLHFLAAPALGFTVVMEVILELLMLGTGVLSTCILFIEAILIFAVNILPYAIVLAGLQLVEKGLGTIYIKTGNSDVRRYVTLSEQIKKSKGKNVDARKLSKSTITMEAYLSGELKDPTADIVGNVMENFNPDKGTLLNRLLVYNDLAPEYNVVSEATSPLLTYADEADSFILLENIVRQPMLSGEGLLHGTMCIVSDCCDKQTLLEFLNCYKETAFYECKEARYKDIPISTASSIILEYCRECWKGNDAMLEQLDTIDQLYGEILTEAYNSVHEEAAQIESPTPVSGFNPDPYNVYDLTPFPVASRRVMDALIQIEDAETDAEITEAMLNFGRIDRVINESYYLDEVDGTDVLVECDLSAVEEAKGTKARNAADKANRKFAKAATKDKSKSIKTAAKRAISPMEKFINNQYTKLKEADKEERRKIILKGGAMPKVWRWVKRGIKLMIGSAIGTVIPAAALITGISFIGMIASDKYLDRRERTKLLQELEDEIQICNEKIDDSRGDDNKQKKYELMRIRNNLKRTQDKIKYGLRY